MCACPCHVDERPDSDLPDVTDVIAAATACQACLPYHTPALLATAPANAEEPPRPQPPLRPWVFDTDDED